MKRSKTLYLCFAIIILTACNSAGGGIPSPTPTFILAVYETPTSTPPSSTTPANEPTGIVAVTITSAITISTSTPITQNEEDAPTPTATTTPTTVPASPTIIPTETVVPTPPPLTGRIAFPVDDGGGYYDVWVVELPDGNPFLVQSHARQPDFSKDGRLLVKAQGGELGESIGLLDANYTWRGILNESPEDSYPFWHPDGSRYTYSNLNLVLDPDTLHLAPYIFTSCSLQLPKFEDEVRCQDVRQWGAIDIGEAPVWTDDDRIAFFTYKGDDGIYFVESASWLREAGGLGAKQLLVRSNGRPTDTAGSQVFFSAGDIDGNWEAYAIDLDGSNLTNLSNEPLAQDGLPTVSPDGQWIAFVSDRDGKWGIWVVPVTGGEPLKVVDMSEINTSPSPWGTGNRDWMLERISWGP